MAENTRPPVAIRIVRPYPSEDELLEHELETVGKTSVILIGAHARPTGVILRFEVTLSTGATILRGEGRVLAHKENAFRGQPGLSLRFTRLDPKSKALVDRAAAIREAKAAGDPAAMSARASSPPAPSSGSSISRASSPPAEPARASAPPRVPSRPPAARAPRADAAIAEALSAETPPPSRPSRGPRRKTSAAPPPSIPPQPPAVIARSEPTPAPPLPARSASVGARPPAPATEGRTVEAPANRAELLARLRDRAATLPPDRVREILSRGI